MPKYIFAGGEIDCVRIRGGTPSDQASAGYYNATYSRSGIRCYDIDVIQGYFINDADALVDVVTGETLWFRINAVHAIDGGNNINFIELKDKATDYAWLALKQVAQFYWAVAYNSGTGAVPVWTEIAATRFNHNGSGENRIVVKWTLGNPHSVDLWVNENPIGSGTFVQNSAVSIGCFRGQGFAGNRNIHFSQIAASEGINLVGSIVASARATAAGNSNTFAVGVYTDVNELTHNDTTVMQSPTAGQAYTLTYSDIAVPAGYAIGSVFTWARGRNDGISPLNFKHVCRRAGADTDSNNVANIQVGFMPLGAQWAADPAGGNWNQANFNAAEWGGKSVA